MRKSVKRLLTWLLMFILIMDMLPAAAAVGGEENLVDVTVTCVWDDDNDDAGERPASVTVLLIRNGADTELTATLSEADGWSSTFPELPASDGSGSACVYTVRELAPDGYLAEYAGNAASGFVITNVKLTEIPDDPIPTAPGDPTPVAEKTGGGSYLYLWLALSIALFVGGTVLARKRRKQRK